MPIKRSLSSMRWFSLLLFLGSLLPVLSAEPLLLAHYMPWYATKEVSGAWGWHWTMNHFDPERLLSDGRRQVASHDYPLIGPYDSGDDHALECQVLLMKMAGLDGVIIDWYGISQINDHAANHRNAQKLIPWLKRAGLRYAVCYEDNAVKSLKPGDDVKQAQKDLEWAEDHFFADANYVRHDGRPLLLVFGPQHLKWKCDLASKPFVFGLSHLVKDNGLDGAFAWPPVSGGKALSPQQWKNELGLIYAQKQPFIATAFPGFQDIYKQASLHESYGSIDARNGSTFAESWEQAIQSNASIIQIATWNDYGEGTVIEPTRGHGYRYLEALPRCGDHADLRLPVLLYELRKRGLERTRLDEAARLLFAKKSREAEAILKELNR